MIRAFIRILGYVPASDDRLAKIMGERLRESAMWYERDQAQRRAIEFAQYMAVAIEAYEKALAPYLSGDDPDPSQDAANADADALSDAWRAVRSAIYEFRKRAPNADPARK